MEVTNDFGDIYSSNGVSVENTYEKALKLIAKEGLWVILILIQRFLLIV